MSITDELRDWVGCNLYYERRDELTAIADRIDEQHRKALERVAAMVDHDGWVELPVDADGVPIHVWDELTNGIDLPAKVRGMSLDEDGWLVSSASFRVGRRVDPSTLRHTRPDTWERILDDAANLVRGDNESVVRLVDRCRRLAGER